MTSFDPANQAAIHQVATGNGAYTLFVKENGTSFAALKTEGWFNRIVVWVYELCGYTSDVVKVDNVAQSYLSKLPPTDTNYESLLEDFELLTKSPLYKDGSLSKIQEQLTPRSSMVAVFEEELRLDTEKPVVKPRLSSTAVSDEEIYRKSWKAVGLLPEEIERKIEALRVRLSAG